MTVRLDPAVSGSLAGRSKERFIVIDAYRRWSCGAWIGDLTASWTEAAPGAGFMEADVIEGVRIMARSNLAGLLDRAGASITDGGRLRPKRAADPTRPPGAVARLACISGVMPLPPTLHTRLPGSYSS